MSGACSLVAAGVGSVDVEDNVASAEDTAQFIEWLERVPPYEQVGRVILEGSRLEVGLLVLTEASGTDRRDMLKMKITQIIKVLRRKGTDSQLLDRCAVAIAKRNLVAHGTWLNLFGRGQALIKHDRDKPGFRGKIISAEQLDDWAQELGTLADAIEVASEVIKNDPVP
jgi:hypothetical protein